MTDEEYGQLPIVKTFDPSQLEEGGISIPDSVPTQIAIPNPWVPLTPVATAPPQGSAPHAQREGK